MREQWGLFKERAPRNAAFIIKQIEPLIKTPHPLDALRLPEFKQLQEFLERLPDGDLDLLGVTKQQIGYAPALITWANVFGAVRLQEYVRSGKC